MIRRRTILLLDLLLAALVLAVFSRTLGYGFVEFDDDLYVTANPHVLAGLTADGLRWAFSSIHAAFWHPLTWLSLMLDQQLHGGAAAGFRLTNLLLHAASALVLFHLLVRMTGAAGRSLFVAALFAIHPLHVESVVWVAERKDVLSTLLGFLTVAAYVRYSGRPSFARYALVAALFLLGLMAKPMLVSLPILLLLLDFWPLGRWGGSEATGSERSGRSPTLRDRPDAAGCSPGLEGRPPCRPLALPRWRLGMRLALEKLPLLAMAAAAAAIAYVAQERSGAVTSLAVTPPGARAANALIGYGTYVVRMVWPANLACFYPYPAEVAAGPLAGSAILFAAVGAAAAFAWRRAPAFAVGWLWYVVTLGPVIGLVRVGSHGTADRYTYVPLVGLFIAAAWGAVALVGRVRDAGWRERLLRRALPVLAVSATAVLSVSASRQCTWWRDTRVLFEHALRVGGGSPLIHTNLGALLYRAGELDRAAYHYDEALRLNPDYASANNNAGVLLAATGRDGEAEVLFRRAVAARPDYAEARSNLGGLLFRRGQFMEAQAEFAVVARMAPADAKARLNLGSALYSLGQVDAALAEYREAARLAPDHAMIRYNMGIAFATLGRFDEAIAAHEASLRLAPGDGTAFDALLFAMRRKGDLAGAAGRCRRELAARPDWPVALRGLAWSLATRPDATPSDRAEAVSAAERAVRISAKADASLYETLAEAYAGVGRLADAREAAARAAQLADEGGDRGWADEIRRRSQRYGEAQEERR